MYLYSYLSCQQLAFTVLRGLFLASYTSSMKPFFLFMESALYSVFPFISLPSITPVLVPCRFILRHVRGPNRLDQAPCTPFDTQPWPLYVQRFRASCSCARVIYALSFRPWARPSGPLGEPMLSGELSLSLSRLVRGAVQEATGETQHVAIEPTWGRVPHRSEQ